MYTVLTSCEAASNSRPLSTTSEHPDDNNLLPITPSHLTIGKSLSPLPAKIDLYEETNNIRCQRAMKTKKTTSSAFLAAMERRIFNNAARSNKELLRKKKS